MADIGASGDLPPQPNQIPETSSSSYDNVVREGWVVEGMMQIQKSIGGLTASVEQVRKDAELREGTIRTDFRWTWTGIASVAVLLVSALIFGYFRLEDRQIDASISLTRIETKLDGILQREQAKPAMPSVH